ncbi:polyprenyl synthetase family protein [Hydrogenobaculum acidophilum]
MIFEILKPKIEERLKELLVPFEPKVLYDAMAYYVFQDGKRIRPVLCVIGGYACDLAEDDAITLGCAIEFIHNYSLIHDDMPELDNDDERRGKPTCHKVFGQDIALLAGDGLLSLAFDILSNEILYENPQNLVKVVNYVSKNAGIEGMVSGQVYDIKGENDFLKVASLKTAALIKTSFCIPAILKGIDYSLYEKLGYNIGILFQLVDDFKDKDGAFVSVGKDSLLDLINEYKKASLNLLPYFPKDVLPYLKEYIDFISQGF